MAIFIYLFLALLMCYVSSDTNIMIIYIYEYESGYILGLLYCYISRCAYLDLKAGFMIDTVNEV